MNRESKPTVVVSYLSGHELPEPVRRLIGDLTKDASIYLDWWKVLEQGYSELGKMMAFASAKFWLFVAPSDEWDWKTFDYQARLASGRNLPLVLLDVGSSDIPIQYLDFSILPISVNYDGSLQLIRDLIGANEASCLVDFDILRTPSTAEILTVASTINARVIRRFNQSPEELYRVGSREFEFLIAELFHGFGYDVELTARTRDGGRDVIAVRRAEFNDRYLIECKKPAPGSCVGIRPVRELYGVKSDEQATKAILATTGYFSPEARLFFSRHRWELEGRDFDGLLDWIRLYLDEAARRGHLNSGRGTPNPAARADG